MGSASKAGLGLLAGCSALGAVAACTDLLGIKDFTAAGTDSSTPSTTDASSSSGSEASSGSGSGSSGKSASGSTSGSASGSTSGSASGGMPVIRFSGYATSTDAGDAGVQTLSPALAWEQSAGDLIVVLINYDLPVSLSEISDTSGNSYTQFGNSVSDQDYIESMYYCLSAKAAGVNANAITVNLGDVARGGTFSVAVFGFTAPGYAWIEDQYTNNSQSNVITVTPGSVTTRYANEVLVSGTGVAFHVPAGSGGGWVAEPSDGLGDLQQYQIVTSIQVNIAPTFTQAYTGAAVSQLGTFAAVPSSHDGG